MGQALKAFAPAEYSVFRDDVMLGFSVIALELRRIPVKAAAAIKVAAIPAVFRRTRALTEEKLLAVLQAAGRVRDRLGFSEVCDRAGCARSSSTREILAGLCEQGLVRSQSGVLDTFGRGQGTVYWADE